MESGEVTTQRVNYSSWAAAPLIDSADKLFGTVSVFSVTEEERQLRAEDLEALSIIAAQVSQAIERKLREEKEKYQAEHDELTGLYNRARFGCEHGRSWNETTLQRPDVDRYPGIFPDQRRPWTGGRG